LEKQEATMSWLKAVPPSKSFIARFKTSESGTAAAEMAIVFPIFLTVLLGIVAYGMYFGAAHSTQQLAADAARVSVAGLDTQERISLARGFIQNNAGNYPLLMAENVALTAGPSNDNPDDFVVTVSYNASAMPIWNLVAIVPLPSSRTIERASVVRRGGLQ